MIYTNKLSSTFSYQNIDADFDIYRIDKTSGKSKRWYGAKQLDELVGEQYKAKAVVYFDDQYIFALLDSNVSLPSNFLKRDVNFEDSIVKKVVAQDVPKRILTQLLLNSLSASRSIIKENHFNNITGKLYYLQPDLFNVEDEFIDIPIVTVDQDFYLQVNIARHRTRTSVLAELNRKRPSIERKKTIHKALNGPNYILNPATRCLKRVFIGQDKIVDKSTYVRLGVPNKKAGQALLDHSDLVSLENNRMAIIYDVLRKTKRYLSAYITLFLQPVSPTNCLNLSKGKLTSNELFIKRIKEGIVVHIVDKTGDQFDSKPAIKSIKEYLKKLEGNIKITSGVKEKKNSLNIVLIEGDKSYYRYSKKRDVYKTRNDQIIRQHLIIQSEKKVKLVIIQANIKELVIKSDIQKSQISLYDWKHLGFKQSVKFGVHLGKGKPFVFLDIDPSGSFQIQTINPDGLFEFQNHDAYQELCDEALYLANENHIEIEGIVENEDQDVNVVFKTNWITLPDVERLMDIGRAVFDESLNVQDLVEYTKEFRFLCTDEDKEKIDHLINALSTTRNLTRKSVFYREYLARYLGSSSEKKKDGKVVIQYRANTKLATSYRDFLLEKYGFILKIPQDNQSKKDLYSAFLNINYWQVDESTAYYFVGEKVGDIQQTFPTANHIRMVKAVKGQLFMEKLLETMDTDFVRLNKSTVLPFVFKYVREAAALVDQKN